MNRKVIIKIFLISLIIVSVFSVKAYCVVDPTTARVKIDNSSPWYNINISESYEECEALNSTSSTLGTEALEAHLTTDYDWNAMAIFSVSQYGAATNNNPSTTTGNNSGVYDVSGYKQSSTMYYEATEITDNFKGLYKEDGTLKKYVNKIDPTTGREYDLLGNETGRIAISYLLGNNTQSWYNASRAIGESLEYPMSIREGLFGVHIARHGYNMCRGDRRSDVTFRPVIWN